MFGNSGGGFQNAGFLSARRASKVQYLKLSILRQKLVSKGFLCLCNAASLIKCCFDIKSFIYIWWETV